MIEILLVNAKGSDHRPVPDLWGERPVRFIDSSQPVPRAAAANRGLDAAKGDWLLFLDDDDYLAPDHLAGLLEAVGQSGAQAAYSHCQAVDGRGRVLPHRFAESFVFLWKNRLARNAPELTDEWRIAGLEVG